MATLASALGLCASRGGGLPAAHAGVWVWIAALLLAFAIGLVAQVLTFRTRCPRCGEVFFQRQGWTPDHTWAGFPTDECCTHCRFNLYRGDNVERER